MFVLPIKLLGEFLHIDMFVQNGITTYGDLMQFFALFVLLLLIILKDMTGILQLALSAIVGLGIMLFSKHILPYFSNIFQNNECLGGIIASVAQRPDAINDFDGFPSGHTTAAFIATGFVSKRYGWKYGIVAITLAILVGLSRLYALRHTTTQVICGALLGFFVAYCITKKNTKNDNTI
ncbi:hypothetical protein CQA53_07300 [Helicobacter didelphidarum]|uniref:Phosphatidic acid phosphatase type 2/haloperoxidase domain-containing protein n=1 Tax=Helicobacter didelphidarum TaxID=2040648 RepID=A0A3D8IIC1_9HELI|nr:phosphatase PAP2 family protein [Helicobacter didelphidarum]RDU64952.1 hypothetical protein CQA53_07300 [Helicobacter didelphidarum]